MLEEAYTKVMRDQKFLSTCRIIVNVVTIKVDQQTWILLENQAPQTVLPSVDVIFWSGWKLLVKGQAKQNGYGERGREGEMYGKTNMETDMTICKIDSQREFAVCLRKLKQGFYTNLEGWDGEGGSKGRGYMYTYGWFMLKFDRKQQNYVKQLSFNKK